MRRHSTSNPAVHGRTATMNHSTGNCATNVSTRSYFTRCARLRSSSRTGGANTTRSARIPRSAIARRRRKPSSRPIRPAQSGSSSRIGLPSEHFHLLHRTQLRTRGRVTIIPPERKPLPNVSAARKYFVVRQLVASSAIECLDEGVLRRLTGRDVVARRHRGCPAIRGWLYWSAWFRCR